FIAYTNGEGEAVSELTVRDAVRTDNNTRNTKNLSDALLMTTSPRIFDAPDGARYDAMETRVKLARYGCDCYAYGMVAAGQVDLVMESGLKVYDIAALIPIIENAGGVVTSWDGEDCSQGGTILAAANETLHAEALKVLATHG
ncbi:MAG: inositol monophosphatase family protein, partial [Pseudomonadota bacterium]